MASRRRKLFTTAGGNGDSARGPRVSSKVPPYDRSQSADAAAIWVAW